MPERKNGTYSLKLAQGVSAFCTTTNKTHMNQILSTAFTVVLRKIDFT